MRTFAFLLGLLALSGSVAARTIDVLSLGAKADGQTLDSPVINQAIQQCAKEGGGVVALPAGTYLCGSIRLLSNVELNIQAGATVLASSDPAAYDPSEPFDGPEYQDGGHTYFHNSLIWADGETGVSITGRGLIDGKGLTKRDTETAGTVHGGSIGMGDKTIALKLCRNVLIRDVTISRGGHFAIIVTGCEYANIDNVVIDTNRDGIDIDCCRFTSVSNCKVNTPSDDAIVLKSSYALKRPAPCENVMISNCLVTGYKLGTTLDGSFIPEKVNWVCGRIKLGTESNGGYRNISISNCSCLYSSGLAFEEVDQGVMENVVVSNISMQHVHHYPIYITTGCRNRGPKDVLSPSLARNIMISNVVATDCDSLSGIQITGMKDAPVENVSLSNIFISCRGGVSESKFSPDSYPELGTKYPEIAKFLGMSPSWGLFARHVKGLRLSNVRFVSLNPDARPVISIDSDVSDVVLSDVFCGDKKL